MAISNHRILDVTPQTITIATKNGKTATLSPETFLRRFLLHVLPRRFVKIRHYGLMASSNVHSRLETARTLLASPTADTNGPEIPRQRESTDALMGRLTGIDLALCPECASRRLTRFPLTSPAYARPPPVVAVA